jgi:hypothetical protein
MTEEKNKEKEKRKKTQNKKEKTKKKKKKQKKTENSGGRRDASNAACLLARDQALFRGEHEIYIYVVCVVVCRLDSSSKGSDRAPALKNSGEN